MDAVKYFCDWADKWIYLYIGYKIALFSLSFVLSFISNALEARAGR